MLPCACCTFRRYILEHIGEERGGRGQETEWTEESEEERRFQKEKERKRSLREIYISFGADREVVSSRERSLRERKAVSREREVVLREKPFRRERENSGRFEKEGGREGGCLRLFRSRSLREKRQSLGEELFAREGRRCH